MTIISAKVIPGCISCKNCENICPEIFKVAPTSHIISDNWNQNALKLLMAEKMCPVQVIKVEKQGEHNFEYSKATVLSKKYLTADIIELVFSCEDFSFIPGQYISLQMKDIRGEFSRSYSIVSGDSSSFTLTIKLLTKGRGSNFLRKFGERNWKTGYRKNTSVDYIGPLGDFILKDTPARKVLIATGTGLAPMIAMLQALPENVEKIVVFGGRYEQDLYYVDILQSFKNTQLRLCVSRPSKDFTGKKGRVTDYIHDIYPDDEVYICGNPDMVQEVSRTLKSDGHQKEYIYHEDFVLAAKPDSLFKTLFFQGNIPGIEIFEKILVYSGVFLVPILYFLAIKYEFMAQNIGFKSVYNWFFDLSWYAVVFVMLVRPLADIFPKLAIFRRLILLRKGFGIFSASIIVSVLLAKWIQNPFTFTEFFTLQAWNLWYPLLARLSEVTAIILLITSNTFSQKKLGIWWKRIQKTSYIYFVSGGIIAAQWSPDKYIYETIILVGILWILAQCKIKLWK